MIMTVSVSENALSVISTANYWVASIAFGVVSIIILMLCARKKKKNSVTMIRYVKNDEMDPEAQNSRSSTNNGLESFERQTEQRISQHSLPNEHRTLPEIPKNGGVTNGAPPTADQTGTPGAVSGESTQRNSASSPKRSRRLPALPPSGQVDLAQAAELARDDRDNDGTYEDLRDDTVNSTDTNRETVGVRDSALYAKVPDDLQKQEDEDNDLYAQVGGDDSDQKPGPSSGQTNDDKTRNKSSSSEDDKTMDSPTAVTYASVDKMKKTMSIKKKPASNTSADVLPPPPVPDRNFDENEVRDTVDSETSVPPLSQSNVVDQTQNDHDPVDSGTHEADETDETGPAYDTVSVRESFAHQRLRQMVEDEQMNRYVNTTRSPDLYSQIDEENPEAVYESVSVPGSADGTVGVTGRNINTSATAQNGQDITPQEDAYSTIGGARTNTNALAQPPPPNGEISNPNYEDIVPIQN